MSTTDQVVHEAETQRQFIRLQLPSTAIIDGEEYPVKDLSSGGMAIRGISKKVKKGQSFDIVLALPFENFALDVDLTIEIQYCEKKIDVVGCRFINLNANQISILNHVIKSYLSGDIVNGNNILNVVSRENFVNVRNNDNNQDHSTASKIKKGGIYLFVVFAILSLSSFIIGNILDNLFVIKSPQAQVYAPSISIKNPISGIYESTLQNGSKSVKKDQIIARIKHKNPSTGLSQYTNIISPCDCFIKEKSAIENLYHSQDETLLQLLLQNQLATINAQVDIQDIHRLKIGTPTVISVTGLKKEIKGSVSNIKTNLNLVEAMPTATVTIQPSEKISLDLINNPAFVEFHL